MSNLTTMTTIESIEEHHTLAQNHARKAVEHAILCGQSITKLKEESQHGAFEGLLEATSVPARTARRYMKAANNYQLLIQNGHSGRFDELDMSLVELERLDLRSDREKAIAEARKNESLVTEMLRKEATNMLDHYREAYDVHYIELCRLDETEPDSFIDFLQHLGLKLIPDEECPIEYPEFRTDDVLAWQGQKLLDNKAKVAAAKEAFAESLTELMAMQASAETAEEVVDLAQRAATKLTYQAMTESIRLMDLANTSD